MKKILFIVVLLTCLITVFGCDNASGDEACEHVWGEWQFNDESHWRYYTCGHDSPEVASKHTWDVGVEVEGGDGAYLMEYTCTVCGKKDQQIITVIPPYSVTEDDIVDKVYVYEKDGAGSDFGINIKADGTFIYYEGCLSSHVGEGKWSYLDGILTLTEKIFRFNEAWELEEVIVSFNFSVVQDALIFVGEGSDNFRYVKVKNGEKFFFQKDAEVFFPDNLQ